MQKKMMLFLLVGLIVAVGAGAYFFSGSKSKKVVPTAKVGVLLPLSEDAATYGFSIKKGIELAKKELGANKIELFFEDSKCDPESVVPAIESLINQGVVAVIGEVCSGATLAAVPIAIENKVVLISPSSTSPELTNSGPYFFRAVPSDDLQGKFGADLVYERGHKKLAVLYSDEPYGEGFKDVLTKRFAEVGGEVVAVEPVSRTVLDVTQQLDKIEASGPDAVYIISNSLNSGGAALLGLHERGLEVEVFGSEALKDIELAEDVLEAAEGFILTTVSSGDSGFKSRYRVEHGEDAPIFSAQGYDAFQALFLAMERGGVTSEEIRDNLSQLEFEGVSGHIAFDQSGDIDAAYEVFIVENGDFVALP